MALLDVCTLFHILCRHILARNTFRRVWNMSTFFWDVTPYSPAEVHRRFEKKNSLSQPLVSKCKPSNHYNQSRCHFSPNTRRHISENSTHLNLWSSDNTLDSYYRGAAGFESQGRHFLFWSFSSFFWVPAQKCPKQQFSQVRLILLQILLSGSSLILAFWASWRSPEKEVNSLCSDRCDSDTQLLLKCVCEIAILSRIDRSGFFCNGRRNA
jgi:hypothetical protein